MLSAFTPRRLFLAALSAELVCARALASTAGPDDGWLQWAEHGNRLHVFRLFQYADVTVGGAAAAPMSHLLERTFDLDPYDRVWVTEGLGYLWGDRVSGDLPESSLIPVHSGVGLAIASRRLQRLPERGHMNVVAELMDRCARSALPGFEHIPIEAVGLAVRNLYPRLASHFDDELSGWDAVVRGCFWHGVGRGAYFATSNWWPTSESRACDLESLRTFASDETARTNALAGFAWAATLVNLHTPDVLSRYLAALIDEREAAAFAQGVTSSLIVWQHAAPEDGGIARLLATDPHGTAGPWRSTLLHDAARDALFEYPRIVAEGRLQDVFHCGAL